MGWGNYVIIIGEKIERKNSAKEIGKLIFEEDSKKYEKELFYIIHEKNYFSIFYAYERRKYLPYWILQEISANYPKIEFAMLGDCPQYLFGPGGLIRMHKGKIQDSYGIIPDRNLLRYLIISNPVKYKFQIYDWYRFEGKEKKLRQKFSSKYPLKWCDENYDERLIPIANSEELNFIIENESSLSTEKWEHQLLIS